MRGSIAEATIIAFRWRLA